MQMVLSGMAWIRFVMAFLPYGFTWQISQMRKTKNVTKYKQKDYFSKCSV